MGQTGNMGENQGRKLLVKFEGGTVIKFVCKSSSDYTLLIIYYILIYPWMWAIEPCMLSHMSNMCFKQICTKMTVYQFDFSKNSAEGLSESTPQTSPSFFSGVALNFQLKNPPNNSWIRPRWTVPQRFCWENLFMVGTLKRFFNEPKKKSNIK